MEKENTNTLALVMRCLCHNIVLAGVGLFEYDFETLREKLPHVGGIGLYAKAFVDPPTKQVQPPIIYIVRGNVDKAERQYCGPWECTKEQLLKFMQRATFPLYELTVMAHEFGHHITSTKNPCEVYKRDLAWMKYISNGTYTRTLDKAKEFNFKKKTLRKLKKHLKKHKKYMSNKEKYHIYEDERKAWCNGYEMLKTIVSTYKIENAQFIFEFYGKCRNICLKNYKDSLWPPKMSIKDSLCFWKSNDRKST